MGPLLALIVSVVAASLLAVLVYAVLFAAAAFSTVRTRRAPDEMAVALDGFLANLLGDDAVRPPGPRR